MSKESRAAEIQDAIRRVLFYDWDPIGIADAEWPEDEYDAYIAPVYRILVGSRSVEDLVRYLRSVAVERMGVGGPNDIKLRNIAAKLLSLDVKIGE